MWVSAHKEVESSEIADCLAKQALRQKGVLEMKAFLKSQFLPKWQRQWDHACKGRHFYQVQKKVGNMKILQMSRKEQTDITRCRMGHIGLNK